MKRTILLVEDDKEMLGLMTAALKSEGFNIVGCENLASAEERLALSSPDMAILDISLPDGSGLALAAGIRDRKDIGKMPVIILTGIEELSTKKNAFDIGIDQYLVKPVDMEELILWVKALFRRLEMDASPAGGLFRAGGLEVDTGSRLAKYRGKVLSDLTNREFDLLAYLVECSPRIVSRDFIIRQVWRTHAVPNLVDTQLHNLRKKLPPPLADCIQTVSGKGFRYLAEK